MPGVEEASVRVGNSRSWTMKVREGKAVLRAWEMKPLEPPSWVVG